MQSSGRHLLFIIWTGARSWSATDYTSVNQSWRIHWLTLRRSSLNEAGVIATRADSVLCRDEQRQSHFHFAVRALREIGSDRKRTPCVGDVGRGAVLY